MKNYKHYKKRKEKKTYYEHVKTHSLHYILTKTLLSHTCKIKCQQKCPYSTWQ